MIENVVSRRYAKALVGLVRESGAYDQVGDELEAISRTIESSPPLHLFVSNPAISKDRKRAVVSSLLVRMGLSSLACQFLLILVEKDRLVHLATIVRYFRELSDEVLNRARATVTAAVDLVQEEQEAIRSRLEQLTGKEIVLTVRKDGSLLGGLLTQIGSTVYDGSVKSQLRQIREQLTQG